MTAAKNVGMMCVCMWYRGREKGAEALEIPWRRADLRQSNGWRPREARLLLLVD